ncbi:MAG: MATE family efflux transporter [Lachnospiraceae bacterium]|nr:MATE family efflux transporter [Lachnospiraceae bacterium]MCI9151397.1 MATE family efflux transporter [Lachnospiraceae bacterium]
MIMQIFVREKQFYRNVLAVGGPIAAQSLITVGVNMMDNIMLGRLGEYQMSGATLANQFINIFHICCMGLGMGASVLTSRYWGMKNTESLKKSVVLMHRMMFVLALLFSAATFLFPRGIMGLFSKEDAVITAGTSYFMISIPCFLLLGFSLTTSLVLRSVGKANIALYSSIGAFFINIFFNWVFIFGNLGAPRMEVRGAALGTLIARVFEFCFIMGYFFFRDTSIRMRLGDLKMKCSDLLGEYIRISLPVLVSDTLLGLGNSMVAVVMGHIGAAFVAANAITTVTQQLSTVVIQGISQASCIITGNTLGEGKEDKAQRQGVTFAAIGLLVGILGCLLILILKNPIIGLYEITAQTDALAHQLMDAVGFIIIFQAMNSILTKGVLRGGGDTKFLMVADILFLWCASIPLGALAGLVLHLPAFWIYFFLKIDQFIKAFWCLFRLKSRKWIKKIKPAAESHNPV